MGQQTNDLNGDNGDDDEDSEFVSSTSYVLVTAQAAIELLQVKHIN